MSVALGSVGRSLDMHIALLYTLDPSEELSLLRCFLRDLLLDSESASTAACWRYRVDSTRLESYRLGCLLELAYRCCCIEALDRSWPAL